MTVEDMQVRISNREYTAWRGFFDWRQAMKEKELRR